jgi:hypothetical protein
LYRARAARMLCSTLACRITRFGARTRRARKLSAGNALAGFSGPKGVVLCSEQRAAYAVRQVSPIMSYAATCVVCGVWRRPVILPGMTRTDPNLPSELKAKSKPRRPAIADPSARFSPERQVPVDTSIGRGANPDCTTPYYW